MLHPEYDIANAAKTAQEVTRVELGIGPGVDLSRSRECQSLTYNFLLAAKPAALPIRREFHRTASGYWHYLIAHAEPDALPAPDDLITDFNPWQDAYNQSLTGYLHGERSAVQEAMLRARLGREDSIALRGIETIVVMHTDAMLRP